MAIGHPDWQDFARLDSLPLVDVPGTVIPAGLEWTFTSSRERIAYDNLLVYIRCAGQPGRLTLPLNWPGDTVAGITEVRAFVNTVGAMVWVVPVPTGEIGEVTVVAAAAGDVTCDLLVAGTNRAPGCIYDPFDRPLLGEVANPIAGGATETHTLPPYTGWVTIATRSTVATTTFWLDARDHNGNVLGRIFQVRLAPDAPDVRNVWIPPWNVQATILNEGAAGVYNFTITPAWGGAV